MSGTSGQGSSQFRTLINATPVAMAETDLNDRCVYVNSRWVKLEIDDRVIEPASNIKSEKISFNGARILLIEDNPVNQKVASRIIEKLGCVVDIAPNGRLGAAAALAGEYEVVLMDCMMPEMDGYEATAEIRRHEPSDQHMPIIALTANATTGDRDRCLEAGMDDFLSKPIKLKDIAATLARWLEKPEPT